MGKADDVDKVAAYFPHVLFVLAQVFSGTFLILLIAPMLVFLASGAPSFAQLLESFPGFWDRLLSVSSFSNLLIWAGLAFPLGICFAEFIYRLGRSVGYIQDLNLDDDTRDATREEQIDLFIWKCRLQRRPWLSRIWEWENFQSNLFLYAEGISVLFVFLLMICIVVIFVQVKTVSGQLRPFLFVSGLWISSVLFFVAMRKGRIGKYEAFRLAHAAVKKLLREEGVTEHDSNDEEDPPQSA
jgi:hypothetical protein